jgi:3-deoxy-D-manno-octulosonic-acid transferase
MPIYNIFIFLIYSLIQVASIFNQKARDFVYGRKNIYNKSFDEFCSQEKECIWFHCASMGEYEDTKKLIDICYEKTNHKILITFSSPTGFNFHSKKHPFAFISYLPYDLKSGMIKFIKQVNPKKIIFSRNDLWPNLIFCAHALKIRLFLVDYTINSKIYTQPLFRIFFGIIFHKLEGIYVQDELTKKKLETAFSLTNVIVTGNTRVDSVLEIKNSVPNNFIEFIADKPVIIFGSALKKDLKILYNLEANFLENFKIVVVEHEPNRNTIVNLQKKFKKKILMWTELSSKIKPCNYDILFVDSIGILKQLYFHCDFAWIGGGFDRIGIHNILEPAIAGNFIAFGPNYRNYSEAIALLKNDETTICHTAIDFRKFIEKKLAIKIKALQNRAFVINSQGASEKCFKGIFT